MFLSKLSVFVLAILAAAGLGIALTMPRPAQRRLAESEEDNLSRARGDLDLLLQWDARRWVDLAAGFGRVAPPPSQPKLRLDTSLDEASRAGQISASTHATVRDTLGYVVAQISGGQKPEFVLAVDKWGRVAASVGTLERSTGEDLSGYFIVQDVLRGYMRDDLWFEGGKLYRIAAAPVVEGGRGEYVGAVLLGDEVDLALCKELAARVSGDVAFFVRGQSVASSSTVSSRDVVDRYEELADTLDERDEEGRVALHAFDVQLGGDTFRTALRRLPGEAGAMDGFVAVLIKRPPTLGFVGTLGQITKDDIGWGHFPWIALGAGFLVVVMTTMALLWIEGDRPARRLADDAVALGKGDRAKLTEEQHRGKLGSIARSVNVALEKLEREAREKRKDLGSVLGPAPEDSVLSTPQPKAAPPPPSAFVFSDQKKGAPAGASSGPPRGAAPAASPAQSAPMAPMAPSAPSFDDDFDPAAAPPLPPTPAVAGRRPPGGPPIGLPPAPLRTPPGGSTSRAKTPPPTPGSSRASAMSISRGADLDAPTAVDDGPSSGPIDSGLLDIGGDGAASGTEESGFQRVFEEYFALKQQCGEATEGLTLEKFSLKLRKNREDLIARYACKSVKFQVYIKDGKAALKATPVRV